MEITRLALATVVFLCAAVSADADGLADLKTPRVVAEVLVEPGTSGELCWRMAEIDIRLKRPARVAVRVDGQPVLSGVDGGRSFEEGTERTLAPGPHRIALDWADLSTKVPRPGVRVPFALDVRDARDPARTETVSGVLETDLINPPVLTVGRTLVSGVDLFDGHVVMQANDHDELAEESVLPITRTYTSAGMGASGVLGAGWSFGWDKTLTARLPCGRDVVHLGDGGGLAFRRELDGRLSPPAGYHSRLIENPDGTYDYFDLGNTRYRFASSGDARRRRERLRLRSVTEPSGAEVVLRHDDVGRVVRVEEKRRGGRRLELTYTRAGGFDRIASIRDSLRRATVRYEYDPLGNLTQVTRTSAAGTRVLGRYRYSVEARDPHQLLSAETGNETMRYEYYREGERFARESTRSEQRRLGLGASVRTVTRETEQGDESTLFGYDDSGWREGTVRSWVASSANDSGWQVTLYVLDQTGRVVEVKEHAPAPTGLIADLPASGARHVAALAR